jgi:hypothetical protein
MIYKNIKIKKQVRKGCAIFCYAGSIFISDVVDGVSHDNDN